MKWIAAGARYFIIFDGKKIIVKGGFDVYPYESFTYKGNYTFLSAGYAHFLFLDTKGNVYSCGDGNYGQLGTGDNLNRDKPVPINYFRQKDI